MKEWCNNQPKYCEADGDDNSGHCLRVAPTQRTKLTTFRLSIRPSSDKRSDAEMIERIRNLSVKAAWRAWKSLVNVAALPALALIPQAFTTS